MLDVPLSVLVVHVHLFFISRQLAERSPYLEALQKEDKEVLFLYEPYDELVLMNLGQFYKKNLKSIENEITSVDKDGEIEEGEPGSLSRTEAKDLMDWISNVLMNKVSKVKVSQCFYHYASWVKLYSAVVVVFIDLQTAILIIYWYLTPPIKYHNDCTVFCYLLLLIDVYQINLYKTLK